MPVFSEIVGGVGKAAAEIIKLFKVDPNQVEQHSFELSKIQAELEKQVQDAVAKEIEAASANIRAEAQSGDKYTVRARPTFLYICNAVIFWNYIVVPLFHRAPFDLPEPLFWLFGSVMLGYVGARSWEKVASGGIKK